MGEHPHNMNKHKSHSPPVGSVLVATTATTMPCQPSHPIRHGVGFVIFLESQRGPKAWCSDAEGVRSPLMGQTILQNSTDTLRSLFLEAYNNRRKNILRGEGETKQIFVCAFGTRASRFFGGCYPVQPGSSQQPNHTPSSFRSSRQLFPYRR